MDNVTTTSMAPCQGWLAGPAARYLGFLGMLDHGEVVRDIIAGCEAWDALDIFDDALEYKTRRFALCGGEGRWLDVDVVYYTDTYRIRRLWSVCITFDASWSLDYAYIRETRDVRCRLVTLDANNGRRGSSRDMLQPVLPPSMLPRIPPRAWAHISMLHASLWKLAPLCHLLPISETCNVVT